MHDNHCFIYLAAKKSAILFTSRNALENALTRFFFALFLCQIEILVATE